MNKKMHQHRGQGQLAGAVWAAAVLSLVLPAAHALFGEFLTPLFSSAWPALSAAALLWDLPDAMRTRSEAASGAQADAG